jgi:hypothetical protein
MLLGDRPLGTVVLGQLRKRKRHALGAILTVEAVLIAGVASVETVPVRFAGGAAFTRPRTSAPGAVVTVAASITPGVARVGHEISYRDQHGRVTKTVVLWGLTDEELCSNELAMAALLDDWDGYALGLYKDAA